MRHNSQQLNFGLSQWGGFVGVGLKGMFQPVQRRHSTVRRKTDNATVSHSFTFPCPHEACCGKAGKELNPT